MTSHASIFLLVYILHKYSNRLV